MGQKVAQSNWLHHFPNLIAIHNPVWDNMLAHARVLDLAPGAVVFRQGEACLHYLLVIEGQVRVQKVTEDGREMTLYRVGSGAACELTTSCLLANDRYHAEAIAETAVRAVLIPKALFQEAVMCSPKFREFVFAYVEKGFTELLTLLEETAYGHVDRRLAKSLLSLRDDDGVVHATHHDLAADLGSAREVVSRQLKNFEQRGWVRLHRGYIEIVDSKGLRSAGCADM